MDAVNHKETTAQIRLYSNRDATVELFTDSGKNAPATRGSIPDDVKRQAMDAVANKETTAQIRLADKDDEHYQPALAPAKHPQTRKFG
jgi:hypothetical protein